MDETLIKLSKTGWWVITFMVLCSGVEPNNQKYFLLQAEPLIFLTKCLYYNANLIFVISNNSLKHSDIVAVKQVKFTYIFNFFSHYC